MTSLEALLGQKETIREMLSRNCTWVDIASEMTKLTGYKLNAGNTNKQVGRYFKIIKQNKKNVSVKIKEYVEVRVRGYRGYKTVHMFINDKKAKGVCAIPDAGKCKYPIGEYPFSLCTHNISTGSYCQNHNELCYT